MKREVITGARTPTPMAHYPAFPCYGSNIQNTAVLP